MTFFMLSFVKEFSSLLNSVKTRPDLKIAITRFVVQVRSIPGEGEHN